MHCRNCGSIINDNAEYCMNCGCKPFSSKNYCQECGADTTEKQEICVKCGCKLKSGYIHQSKPINIAGIMGNTTNDLNLDFTDLDSYYQKEFVKIYESQETYKGKFNGWAFLFGPIWALTKGVWLSPICCIVLSALTFGIVSVVYSFIAGFRGNYWYYCAHTKNSQCII